MAPDERAREMLLMGLRLNEGIDPARFERRTGIALADALDAETLSRAVEAGYIEFRSGPAPGHPGRAPTA